jgi:hypothetical protein
MNYQKKYLKYKNKYLDIKNSIQIGGNDKYSCKSIEQFKKIENITIHDFCFKDPKGKYENLVDCTWSDECLERYFSRKNPRLREKKNDIKIFLCRNGEPGCIICKLCNSVSRIDKIIEHKFDCKYFEITSEYVSKQKPAVRYKSNPEIIEQYLNRGIRSFGLDVVLHALHVFLSSYPKNQAISIGSGNGIFEYIYADKYKKDIICVDPYPLSFLSYGLREAFKKPDYHYVTDLLNSKPELEYNSVLILNWCYFNMTYDLEAINDLKPLAFFTIFDKFGSAGSFEFNEFLRKTSKYELVHRISLTDSNLDICIEWWQKVELPKIKPALKDRVKSKLTNELYGF